MRQCNGCTECCILGTAIKPLGILCPEACGGCKIYDKRPTECRTFRCTWLAESSPSRPKELGAVIYLAKSPIGKVQVVVALTGGEMTAAIQAEIEAVFVAIAQEGREVEDLTLVWTPPQFRVNVASEECLAQRPAFSSIPGDAPPVIYADVHGTSRFIRFDRPTRAAPSRLGLEGTHSTNCSSTTMLSE
ncbi:MAG: hypothetical protein ABSG53_18210 [Thermoguttaceae bacterium]|jgi:hypothetical protein